MKNEPKHSILKLIIVSALCLAALAFAVLRIIGSTSRNVPDMQVAGAQEARFTQERRFNRTEFREELHSHLNLNKEQEEAMAEIRKNMQSGDRSHMFEHMRAMREVLTPEQRESMQSFFRQHIGQGMRGRMERLQKVLPPGEYKKFMDKLEERHERFRGHLEGPPGREM